jgi:hypothetical protein
LAALWQSFQRDIKTTRGVARKLAIVWNYPTALTQVTDELLKMFFQRVWEFSQIKPETVWSRY